MIHFYAVTFPGKKAKIKEKYTGNRILDHMDLSLSLSCCSNIPIVFQCHLFFRGKLELAVRKTSIFDFPALNFLLSVLPLESQLPICSIPPTHWFLLPVHLLDALFLKLSLFIQSPFWVLFQLFHPLTGFTF